MCKNLIRLGFASMLLVAFASCSDEQQFTNENTDAKRIDITQISSDMAKVRDYVPLYAVIAHRGSTFWTPEETEASWRWAREMGADYLESDMQATKDGVVLANHDENLKRTTNVEDVYSDYVPSTRKDFYRSFKNADGSQHFSEADIEAQYQRDVNDFRTYYTMSYYYAELLKLDAGTWFNDGTPEQARPSFSQKTGTHLYVSALQDQIAYAQGKMLNRDANGERILPYHIKAKYQNMTLEQIYNATKKTAKCDDSSVEYSYAAKYMDFVEYDFSNAYVADPQDTGNRPGVYIEFKESWLNPKDMEVRVYNVLNECGWNIITKPENTANPFYKSGKVNVGNTNGKVILQTFSFDALHRAFGVFQGKVPMCYLLWTGDNYATDLNYATPTGYADFINYSLENGAHILGPAISGAPNNYPEMNKPWQAYMIRKSGMLNHPYSFDSYAQMSKYMGYYTDYYGQGNTTEFDDLLSLTIPATSYTNFTGSKSVPVYLDGYFTNRTEISLRYMLENGFRGNANLPNPFHAGQKYDNSQAPTTVPDAEATLTRLGY
ncbi:MAG: glycerophosphodiester phosphodiesterase [Muribaculaceae bacterium]|jgi:glycerophosphoryl diester phosphodiesterase|nr:glycerophosphodiester phosphodiesterase [Muribaculaceae bacterium]